MQQKGSEDIRSAGIAPVEKQVILLKIKSSLPFSTDFAKQDKAIQM